MGLKQRSRWEAFGWLQPSSCLATIRSATAFLMRQVRVSARRTRARLAVAPLCLFLGTSACAASNNNIGVSLAPGASNSDLRLSPRSSNVPSAQNYDSPTSPEATDLSRHAWFSLRRPTVKTEFLGPQFQKIHALIKLHYFHEYCLSAHIASKDPRREGRGIANFPDFELSLDDIETISQCFEDAVLPSNCLEHQQATIVAARLIAGSEWLAPLKRSARELLIYCTNDHSEKKNEYKGEENRPRHGHLDKRIINANQSVVEYLIELQNIGNKTIEKNDSRAIEYSMMVFMISHFRTAYNFHQIPDTDSRSDAPPARIGSSIDGFIKLGLADELIYSIQLLNNERALRSLDIEIDKWLERRGSYP